MKILVIDDDKNRGENIRDRIRKLSQDRKLASLGILTLEDIIHQPQVAPEGTPCYQAIIDAKGWEESYKNDYHLVTKEQYVLILLHTSNQWIRRPILGRQNSFYHEKCRGIPTVFYSGGGCQESSEGLTYYHRESVDSGKVGEKFFLEEFLIEWASLTDEERKIDSDIKYATPPFDILSLGTREVVDEQKRQTLQANILESFVALDILLQGYLVVKNPDAFFQQFKSDWQVDTSASNFVKAQATIEKTPSLWFRECWSDMETIFSQVDKGLDDLEARQKRSGDVISSIGELRDLLSPKGNSALIEIRKAIEECRKDCAPEGSDQCPHVDADGICQRCKRIGNGILFDEKVVKHAHDDFLMAAKWFEKKKVVDEFLEFRAFVSHTLLKNRFMLGDLANQHRNRNRLLDPYEWPLLQRKIEDMLQLGASLFGIRCDAVFVACKRRVDDIIKRIEDFKKGLATEQPISPQQQKAFTVVCEELKDELTNIPALLRQSDAGFSPKKVTEALKGVKPSELRNQVEVSLKADIAPLLFVFDSKALEETVKRKNSAAYWQHRSDLDNLLLTHRIYRLFHGFDPSEVEWEGKIKAVLEGFDKLAGAFRLSLTPERRRAIVGSYLDEQHKSSVKDLVADSLRGVMSDEKSSHY